jgi:hypothetical protein
MKWMNSSKTVSLGSGTDKGRRSVLSKGNPVNEADDTAVLETAPVTPQVATRRVVSTSLLQAPFLIFIHRQCREYEQTHHSSA